MRLRNGAFSLAEPLSVELSQATWTRRCPTTRSWSAFQQRIGASEPLRSGTYSGTVTLTLATTNP